MNMVSAAEARARLDELIDAVAANHAPVTITGATNNAVLVSTQDWAAINETIFLLSIRGMRESILDGTATPTDECATKLDW